MHADFLLGAGLVLAALAVAGALFLRIRQSVIPAYILLGVALRPDRFDEGLVENLATLGVVLLLFYVGLEFSLRALLENRRAIMRAGGIDLLAALPVGLVAGMLLGHGWVGALLFGGAFYVSSSAIVAKSVINLRRAADPETEVALGILVFEDLAIAVYLALLSGAVLVAEPSLMAGAWGVGKAVLFFLAVVMAATRARPLLSRLFDVTDDLFVLMCGGMVLLLSWAALRAGISEAIGAFLAGVVVAETRHRERADRLFAPLQGVFAAIFFFAFGLSMDPRSFGAVWLPAVLLALLAIAVKLGGGWLAGRRGGLSKRGALSLGLTLIARGEFSIILAGLALSVGLNRLASLIGLFVLILAVVGSAATQYAPAIALRVFPSRPPPDLAALGFRPELAGHGPPPTAVSEGERVL